MDAITFLATSRKPSAPAHRAVTRRFNTAGNRATVETRHPQLGMLTGGTIVRTANQPEDGALGRWLAVDPDGVRHGPIVGDYLDAEQVLLDATEALEQPAPPARPVFDTKAFRAGVRQFADHAAGYAALGLDAATAAGWANHGFLPNEAASWVADGFTADQAAPLADLFITPAEAVGRRTAGSHA